MHRKHLLISLFVSLTLTTANHASAAALSDADALAASGRFDEAIAAYRALSASDTSGDAFAGLAVALAKKGDAAGIKEAEELTKTARQEFPANANLTAAAGYVAYAHSLQALSPAGMAALLNYSQTLLKLALAKVPDNALAKETYAIVSTKINGEGNYAGHMKLAAAALEKQDFEIAATEYKTALEAKPNDANALMGLFQTYTASAKKDGKYPPGHQDLLKQIEQLVGAPPAPNPAKKDGPQLPQNAAKKHDSAPVKN